MSKFEFPEKHPVAWACLCIGTVSFPQWLSGVWALFSEEPLARVVARSLNMNEIPFSPFWITVPLGLLMFGYLLYWIVTGSKEKSAATPLTPKPITKTSEETENERFHNRRKGSLTIEFSNDYSFKSIGPTEGHGIRTGHLQMYRIAVHNTTEVDIGGVQVWLENITPMPPELMGHGGLPLHITHEAEGVNMITLKAHDNRRVDVVSYFDNFGNPHIRIHHTSAVAKQEIYDGERDDGGDDGYEIELVAKGEKVERFSRRFKIGVRNRDLFMVSLDQPPEESMAEGYRDA